MVTKIKNINVHAFRGIRDLELELEGKSLLIQGENGTGKSSIVEAIELARQKLQPGIQGVEVDKVAREYIIQNGYEEFPHGLGHQVGRFAHDGTALLGPAWEKYANKPFEIIEEGMVFTIEPRLTVPDYGVATIEEMVLVTSAGAEFISTPQKEEIMRAAEAYLRPCSG